MQFKHLFILFLFLSAPLFGGDLSENARKYYCSPKEVELHDAVIFVKHHGEVVEIDSLYVDQGGLYFLDESIRCTDCRRPNPKNICQYCVTDN